MDGAKPKLGQRPPRKLSPIDFGVKQGGARSLLARSTSSSVPKAVPAQVPKIGPAAVPAPPWKQAPLRVRVPLLPSRRIRLSAPTNGQRVVPGSFVSSRYEPEKVIGQGGRGAVYKAWDRVLGVHVALKFLPEALARNPQALEEIRREAVVAMRLSHENIVRLHNVEMSGTRLFLVMEYVDGENLREIVERLGPLAPFSVLDIARSCASALAYTHGEGIVHRDIKPENIMINKDAILKIVDFGTAMMAHLPGEDAYLEGTPGYMSPEQIRGNEPVDARTDIFALGAVLAELMTGKRAFVYDGNLDHLLASSPQGLEVVDPPIRAVLLKAMATVRDERWASAMEFYRALENAVEGGRAGG